MDEACLLLMSVQRKRLRLFILRLFSMCFRPLAIEISRSCPSLTLLHLGPGLANAIANLHNAKRAGTPLLNIVGDMATWHHGADALLEMDIEGLAATVSTWVHTSRLPGAMQGDAVEALQATRRSFHNRPCVSRGRVVTLIVPHDRTWENPSGSLAELDEDDVRKHEKGCCDAGMEEPSMVREFIARCAAALVSCASSRKTALYCGNDALISRADGGALESAGEVARLAGAELLCENAFPRIDRGGDLPLMKRLPYFPKDAAKMLSSYDMVVVLDARRPIAMFGYKDSGPSHVMRLEDDNIWDIDAGVEVAKTVEMLLEEVKKLTSLNNGAMIRRPQPPSVPQDGRLTASAMCAVIAATQPEGAVIVDESLTSGGSYWDLSAGCPKFSHMTLTGGAIGFGPPAAIGAAVACPGRRVINIQADGSGMYSAQALWTQARERLDVVTVICSNRAYAILKLELAMQGVGTPGKATQQLTDLGNPPIQWTSIAEGYGVPSVAVDTVYTFRDALVKAISTPGPTLIEALLQ